MPTRSGYRPHPAGKRRRKLTAEQVRRRDRSRHRARRRREARERARLVHTDLAWSRAAWSHGLTFPDPRPESDGDIEERFRAWADLLTHCGVITFAVGVLHRRDHNGRRTRPNVHAQTDLHPEVATMLDATPRREWMTTPLPGVDRSFGQLAAQVGFGDAAPESRRLRPFDSGGPGYVLGEGWGGPDELGKVWTFGEDALDAFVKLHQGAIRAVTLDATKDSAFPRPDEPSACSTLIVHRALRPPRPSRTPQRARRHMRWNGSINSWLRHACSRFGAYTVCYPKQQAWHEYLAWCNAAGIRPTSLHVFREAMDAEFDGGHGVWFGVTSASAPITPRDVFGEVPPPRPESGQAAAQPPLPEMELRQRLQGFTL